MIGQFSLFAGTKDKIRGQEKHEEHVEVAKLEKWGRVNEFPPVQIY